MPIGIDPGICMENGGAVCGWDDAYPVRLRCIDPWPPAIVRRCDELELDHKQRLTREYETRGVERRCRRKCPNCSLGLSTARVPGEGQGGRYPKSI